MGQRFAVPRRCRQHTYISVIPILSPLSAGRAMMVSPHVVLMSLAALITGTSHEDDCQCRVCVYNAGSAAIVEADTQKRFERLAAITQEPVVQAPNRRSLFDEPADSTFLFDNDEPWYWAQWCVDNFGPSFEPRMVYIASMLDGMETEQAGVFLFDAVRDQLPWASEALEHWDEGSPDDPDDAWEGLFYLSSLMLVGAER